MDSPSTSTFLSIQSILHQILESQKVCHHTLSACVTTASTLNATLASLGSINHKDPPSPTSIVMQQPQHYFYSMDFHHQPATLYSPSTLTNASPWLLHSSVVQPPPHNFYHHYQDFTHHPQSISYLPPQPPQNPPCLQPNQYPQAPSNYGPNILSITDEEKEFDYKPPKLVTAAEDDQDGRVSLVTDVSWPKYVGQRHEEEEAPDSELLNSPLMEEFILPTDPIEAPSFSEEAIETIAVAETSLKTTNDASAVRLTVCPTTTISREKHRRLTITTEVSNTAIPVLKRAPLKPPEPGISTRRNGLFTAAAPPSTVTMGFAIKHPIGSSDLRDDYTFVFDPGGALVRRFFHATSSPPSQPPLHLRHHRLSLPHRNATNKLDVFVAITPCHTYSPF